MAYIELSQNDSTETIARKCNENFKRLDGSGLRNIVSINRRIDDFSYEDLNDRPSIESVELVGDKTFPDLGIFKTDDQGYDVSDNYTLTSIDINALWINAAPVMVGV